MNRSATWSAARMTETRRPRATRSTATRAATEATGGSRLVPVADSWAAYVAARAARNVVWAAADARFRKGWRDD
jgi:hypothetical protein